MQDMPSAAELIEAVREFLEHDIYPVVEGRAQFHTRVAMNVLGIVQRELELSLETDQRERVSAAALLERTILPNGQSTTPDTLRSLNDELARRIRDDTLASSRNELLDHLRSSLRDKLAIANPKYIDD